jgi:glycosyltransferase involved in cell wall biosynthesis
MNVQADGETPRISVIIPAYNHESYILDAVKSVLEQTWTDFELIIIDDGSTDRTLQVLEGIADPRIRLVRQENRGAAGTINRGIDLAQGQYIAILNSDDLYHPERLARMTQHLDDHPEVMLVYSLVQPIEASGSPVQPTNHAAWQKWYEDALQQIRRDESSLQSLLKYNYVVSTSNIMMRRSFFDSHEAFNERLTYCHDYELLLRVCKQYPVHGLQERLVHYRLHEGNTINQNAFLRHLEVLYCLFTTMDIGALLAKPSLAERSADDLYRGLIENPEINPDLRLSELNAMLETRDRQLQQADTWLRDFQSQSNTYHCQLENLSTQIETKDRQLQEIYASRGWRWLTRFRTLKQRLFFWKNLIPSQVTEGPIEGAYHARIIHPVQKRRPKVMHAIANMMTGGSSRLVVDLIEHLGHRYDQEVMTLFLPRPPQYTGFPCHDFSEPLDIDRVTTFLRDKETRLLHIHYWGDCDDPWYRKVFQAVERVPCSVIENINTPVAPLIHSRVDRYVYVSQYAQNFSPAVKEKAEVIYPGSNLTLFQREGPDISDDTIGMVYRLEGDKLREDSIEVLIDVVKRRPHTKALVVGGGTFFEVYQKQVHDQGVAGQFVFTDYVAYEELPTYYRKLSLFVAPVWKESFGQVSAFAMSMKIPVAGYDIGALSEILGSSECLRNTKAELVELIISLLDDREKRIRIGESNHTRVEALFSVETMVRKYDRLYRQLLGEG